TVGVEALPLRGEPIRGELRGLSADEAQIAVAGGAPRTIATRYLLSLQLGQLLPRAPGSARIELAGGDVIVAPIAGGKGDVLEVLLGGMNVKLPVEAMRRVDFPDRVPPGVTDLPSPSSGDRLFQRSRGGSVEPGNGTLIAFHDKGVEFESAVIGRKGFPYDEAIAL